MPKQLNIRLGFEADTKQAQQQIAQLQKSLDGLLNSSIKQGSLTGFNSDIAKAQQSILQLKTALNNSLNADTGRLDLSKFNGQLNSSGLTLSSLSKDMSALGTDGQKAFLNLANSIVTAQKPMVESNKLLDGMWTALKNTARWQMSSSILHGLVGALQGAYGYAQDLNKSLTDIAIVTGRSTDQMAAFAEQANKSAQALSVSTTAYTDAALIYYQQGLDDEAVKARTDITMQMSNVTGESAEHVSSYMTAIWNNFAEGSENLEHYADVITALGAATASSSEEIANGMQQFAAVADTVGLSYEYAATALATVVAQTRQSESTVGNSFRTIFSRLQGLKLGETLEDGTDLNKYSKALATVGVNIKDQNGELKDMDTILDEIGAKWQTLAKDQQIALAQTVGGVRQYTNLVALFDNWDTFQKNLNIANTSDGALQQQADTYAQSWEAAQKRVKAAWQAIYQDLIDDKFFITILNAIEKILQGIDWFIDSIGGLKGVLSGLGVIFTSVFEKQMVGGIEKAQLQLSKILRPSNDEQGRTYAEIQADKMANDAMELAMQQRKELVGGGYQDDIILENLEQQLKLNSSLRDLRKKITEEEFNSYQQQIKNTEEYAKQSNELSEIAKKQQAKAVTSAAVLRDRADSLTDQGLRDQFTDLIEDNNGDIAQISLMGNAQDQQLAIEGLVEKYNDLRIAMGASRAELTEWITNEVQHVSTINQLNNSEDARVKSINKLNTVLEIKSRLEKGENLDDIIAEKKRTLEINEQTKALQDNIKELEKRKIAINNKLKQENLNQVGKWTERRDALQKKLDEELKPQLEEAKANFDKSNPVHYESAKFNVTEVEKEIAELDKKIQDKKTELEELHKQLDNITNDIETTRQKAENETKKQQDKYEEDLKSSLNPQKKSDKTETLPFFLQKGFANSITSAFRGISSLTMGINALSSAWNTIKDPNTTGWQKFSSLMMGISMGLPALATGFLSLTAMLHQTTLAEKGVGWAAKQMWTDITGPIGIVIAAIGLIGAAIYKVIDDYNAADKAAEKARKKAEESKKAFEDLKTSFEELKNSLENHQSAIKALEDLKTGTEEWHESVSALNQDVLELIKKYPELAKYVNNNNGVLSLDKEGYQSYLNKEYQKLQEANWQSIQDDREANRTDRIAKETNLSRQIGYYRQGDAYNKDNATSGSGSFVRAELNEVKAAIDIYNETNGAAYGTIKDLEAAFNERGIYNEQLIASFKAHTPEIKELAIQVQETAEAENAVAEIFAKTLVENQIGDNIREIVGDGKGDLVGGIETIFAKEVETALNNGVDLADALLEIEKKFADDSSKYVEEARKNAFDNLSKDIGSSFGGFGRKVFKDSAEDWDANKMVFAESVSTNGLQNVQEWIDKVNELYEVAQTEFSLNIDPELLSNYKGKTEDLTAEVRNLTEFIQKNADDYQDLSENIKTCDAAAEGLAWSLIRFDDAMQDVSKNYEDWKTAFKNPDDILGMNKAITELRKTYGNLLDLDGSKLSEEFLKDGDNLERMNKILNGTEEEAIAAYDELAKLAAISVAKEYAAELNINFNEEKFNTIYDTISSEVERLQLIAGDPIEIGEPDFAALKEGLEAMLAFVGNDVTAAKALYRQLGFQAEFDPVEAETEDEQEQTDLTPKIEQQTGDLIGGGFRTSGNFLTPFTTGAEQITAPSVTWEEGKKHKVKGTKKTSVGGLKIRDGSLQYLGGGSPIIKNSPARKIRSGGGSGSCFIAGTQISLSNSYKNIEDIKPGDIVLSYNEKKKKNVFNKVLQTMIHFVHEKIYSLFIKDEKIKATGNHKFLIIHNNNQKWTEVSDIQIGDLVLFSDGTWHEISDIDYEVKHETVYNFEVSDTHNYYVGKNQVLAHNKGGGGGKNSAPKKQKREKPVQEKDRYHDLKEKIKDLTTETSRLEKISSRVWGKEKLKYMDQEIKKQEKQIDLTKEYIKEAKNYLAEDKKRLDEIKMGAKYVKDDNTGEWLLTNYEEVLQNIVDAQNKAVDAFNDAKGRYENGEISEDELKAQEEAFNLDKEKFEERKKILKQYEDTYNTVQEQMEKLIDDQWKLYDLKLEKVKVEVELELKVSDQSKKILEWSFKYLGNDLDAVSDKVANLSSQMNYLAQDLATAQKGISGIFANHGINFNWNENTPVDQIIKDLKSQIGGSVYSALTESEVDALMEYMNKLMEVHDAAAEKMKEVMDTFSTAVEKANEKLERQLNRFDGLKSTLTTYQDIVNLTGKNILKITSKNLEDLNKAMIQNDQNKLTSARAIYETNKGMYEAARTELNEALASGDAQLVEQLEEQLNSLEDTMNDALENYRDALKETLEDVQQAWEDALDAMEEAYEEAFGNLGSNWYQEQFDRQKELNELYLPDYKKYHELNKSMTELQKNLANTNNQIVKGKAKELLEDINDKMKSGAQVSEYEAGIIERRVALLKAEDELLAARNAKSTVRMTRDNEGGFSYTYTADEDQINNAQQGYSDAYYELRDYQVTGANDLQSQWLQIQGEFAQRVREIEEQYRDNEAARTEALKQLQTEYQTYVNYFSDQMGIVYKWESTLRDNDLKDLQRVTGLKLDEWDTYITSWNDTLLNTVIPGYDTYDQLLDTWDKAMNTAITSVNKAHDNYRKNVEVTMDKAGMSVSGFKEQFEKDMANVQLDSDQTTGNIKTLTETTMTNFGKALEKVSGFTQDYLNNFYKVRADNKETVDSIQDIITALSGLNTSMDTANTKAQTLKTDTVDAITKASEAISTALEGAAQSARDASGAIKDAMDLEDKYKSQNTSDPWVKVLSTDGKEHRIRKSQMGSDDTLIYTYSYDTGGYTGDWHSSEGRPAILHEKELVLNKEDTKNMLDAVNVIRSMQTPINGLARNMFNYNSLNNVGSADTLEQQVHIDATFPNVSDHNEIELALNNLVNSASQYVNRK